MALRFPDVASDAYQYPLMIRHLLDCALMVAPDQTIIYRGEESYTYAELARRVGRLATTL